MLLLRSLKSRSGISLCPSFTCLEAASKKQDVNRGGVSLGANNGLSQLPVTSVDTEHILGPEGAATPKPLPQDTQRNIAFG